MTEQLLTSPGFLYELNGSYYYLGKWICKECVDTEATDCVMMYQMCRNGHEEPETNMYFQKLRAFSDFALEVPYNPEKIKQDMSALVDKLSDRGKNSLEKQFRCFTEDLGKYCG